MINTTNPENQKISTEAPPNQQPTQENPSTAVSRVAMPRIVSFQEVRKGAAEELKSASLKGKASSEPSSRPLTPREIINAAKETVESDTSKEKAEPTPSRTNAFFLRTTNVISSRPSTPRTRLSPLPPKSGASSPRSLPSANTSKISLSSLNENEEASPNPDRFTPLLDTFTPTSRESRNSMKSSVEDLLEEISICNEEVLSGKGLTDIKARVKESHKKMEEIQGFINNLKKFNDPQINSFCDSILEEISTAREESTLDKILKRIAKINNKNRFRKEENERIASRNASPFTIHQSPLHEMLPEFEENDEHLAEAVSWLQLEFYASDLKESLTCFKNDQSEDFDTYELEKVQKGLKDLSEQQKALLIKKIPASIAHERVNLKEIIKNPSTRLHSGTDTNLIELLIKALQLCSKDALLRAENKEEIDEPISF